MISANCNFSDFVAAIKDKSYYDVIHLADLEATEAERLLYRMGVDEEEKIKCGQKYASVLKDLISYMRYNIRPTTSKDKYLELFEYVLERVNANDRAMQA